MDARIESRRAGWDASALILLTALVTAGVLLLLYFTSRLLMVGRLGSLSLPLVALVAAAASAFNPCALPALPGFFIFCGGRQTSFQIRLRLGLAAAAGAVVVLLVILGVVAFLGMEAQMLVAPGFSWAQLALGLVIIALAAAQLLGLMARLPLLGHVAAAGARLWDRAVERPNPAGAFLFGAGFLAVGGT